MRMGVPEGATAVHLISGSEQGAGAVVTQVDLDAADEAARMLSACRIIVSISSGAMSALAMLLSVFTRTCMLGADPSPSRTTRLSGVVCLVVMVIP